MAYVLSKTGTLDKVKLIKILYIADRDCFVKHGWPITRDRQCAMLWGPVPSGCLDLINGNVETDEPFECLRVENERISLTAKAAAIPVDLSPEEREVLDETIAKYKDVPTWTLVRMTHAFPEYRETYEDGTSTTIPYDLILKLHAPGRHRNNRPVISPAMAANMISPFARSEPDL